MGRAFVGMAGRLNCGYWLMKNSYGGSCSIAAWPQAYWDSVLTLGTVGHLRPVLLADLEVMSMEPKPSCCWLCVAVRDGGRQGQRVSWGTGRGGKVSSANRYCRASIQRHSM